MEQGPVRWCLVAGRRRALGGRDRLTRLRGRGHGDERAEYAAAGIPQYWVVDQDAVRNITMHYLTGAHYSVRATMPLKWVLNTSPAEYDLF
jgi:hypothetical protein